MKKHGQQPAGYDKGLLNKGKSGEKGAGEAAEENCRCQEVSKKTVPELLKIMISDLAFWKKAK